MNEPIAHTSLEPDQSRLSRMEYEEAFEITGHGLFNYMVIVAGTLVYIHALLEMIAIAYIITPAECDLQMSVFQKSMINSSIFIGVCITSIIWGVVTDHLGRRPIILPTVIGAIITSFISSLCTRFVPMFTFRLLTGCLISASSATSLVYVGELLTEKHKDRAMTIIFMSAQISFVLLPALCMALLPQSWSFNMASITIKPWRTFMWIWGLIGLLGATILFFLPESPRFLLLSKGSDAVQPVLAKIYAMNLKKQPSDYPVKSILEVKTSNSTYPQKTLVTVLTGIRNDFSNLLRPPMLRCYALTHICMFLTFLSCNGIYIWLPDFINEVLGHMESKENMCALIRWKYHEITTQHVVTHHEEDPCSIGVNYMIYLIAMGMELIYLVPFLLVLLLIKKYSKKWLYAIIHWISSIGLILGAIVPNLPFALFFIMVNAITASCCPLVSALAIEAFPTSLRALAMCTLLMAGQIGAVVGNSVIAIMKDVSCIVVCLVIATSSSSAAIMLIKMWPDVKIVRREMEAKGFSY